MLPLLFPFLFLAPATQAVCELEPCIRNLRPRCARQSKLCYPVNHSSIYRLTRKGAFWLCVNNIVVYLACRKGKTSSIYPPRVPNYVRHAKLFNFPIFSHSYSLTFIYNHFPSSICICYLHINLRSIAIIYRHLPSTTFINPHIPSSTFNHVHFPSFTLIHVH